MTEESNAQTEMILKIMTEWKQQLYNELQAFDDAMKTMIPETSTSKDTIPGMAFQLAMRLKERTLTGIKDVDMTISECLFEQGFSTSKRAKK